MMGVYPHQAGLQLRCHLVRTRQVLCPYACPEPVSRVIGKLHTLAFSLNKVYEGIDVNENFSAHLELSKYNDWPKNLFLP